LELASFIHLAVIEQVVIVIVRDTILILKVFNCRKGLVCLSE
jgi:hypothetical protein